MSPTSPQSLSQKPKQQQQQQQQQQLAIIGLILTSVFWAGNAIVARLSVGDIGPFSLSFWRWCLPCLYLSPLIFRAWKRHGLLLRQNWLQLILLSMLSISLYNTILYLAAMHTTSINITLVTCGLPIGTLIFAFLLLNERPGKKQLLGGTISLIGVLIILSSGSLDRLLSIAFNRGDLLMLVAVASWSLYSVLLKKWPLKIPAFDMLCLLMSLGMPLIAPFYLWELANSGAFELSTGNIGLLAYVAVFPSVLAYLLWNNGIHRIGPGKASVFSYLIPVFTAAMAITFLQEQLHGYHLVGGVLAFVGIYLSSSISHEQTTSDRDATTA
jgi:drug/metabolite transporter (DMT)-like permease